MGQSSLDKDIMNKLPPLPPKFVENTTWNIRRCVFTQEVQRLLGEVTNQRAFPDALPGPNTWRQLQELRIKLELEPYSPEDMTRFSKI